MAALISFFIVIIISFVIVRIATVLLRLTGMTEESARFQARSAFTGTGFTTSEAEHVVNHPVRRRIIMSLMLVRNAGFITVLSSLTLSFINARTSEEVVQRIIYLSLGTLLLVIISRSRLLDLILTRIVRWALRKWTKIRVNDYDSLLNLSAEYEVIESSVSEISWLAEKPLNELQLTDEGVLILGVRKKDGTFIGTPRGDTVIYPGDRIVMYGKEESLQDVGKRKAGPEGDLQHEDAVNHYRGQHGRKPKLPAQSSPEKRSWIQTFFGKRSEK